MPRLATDVAGQCVSLRLTFTQEPLQHNSIDVFVGVDVGKGQHHAVVLDRSGKRLYNKALPNKKPNYVP